MKKTLSILTIVVLVLTGCTKVYNPDAQFSASFTDAFTGESVIFTNLSTEATSYLWDFGDGTTSTGYDASHTYSQSATYTVTLTAYNHNRASTSTIVIQVYSPAALNILVKEYKKPYVVSDASILLFESVSLWDTHTGGNAIADVVTNNEGIGIIYNLFPGTYFIDAVATDYDNWHLGQISTDYIQVTVSEGIVNYVTVEAEYYGITKSASANQIGTRTSFNKTPYHHRKISK